MTNEQQRTPGPWRVEEIPYSDSRNFRHGYDLAIEPEIAVIEYFEGEDGKAEARANADFIVAACNAHDALLAACRALPLDKEFSDAADFVDASEKFRRAMDLASFAIALATGEGAGR